MAIAIVFLAVPISAKKTTTKAKHRVWKKTLLTVEWLEFCKEIRKGGC